MEEKVAYLERHVTAQDKVMLELSDLLARVRAELKMLRERAGDAGYMGVAPPLRDVRGDDAMARRRRCWVVKVELKGGWFVREWKR